MSGRLNLWRHFGLVSFAFLLLFVSHAHSQRRLPTTSSSGQSRGQQSPPQQPSISSSRGPTEASRQSPAPSKSNDDDDELESGPGKEGGSFACPKSDGLFPDTASCRKFYLCGNWKAWSQTCPPSLYFDSKLKFCTFKTESLTCGPIDEAEVRAEERELSQDALPICDINQCQLPGCFCTNDGTLIPGNLQPANVPQMVLISFSGALNDLVFDHYRKVLGYGNKFSTSQTRRNPNGCGIRSTFFINHEYSNYAQIQWFAAQGHEIAMHSITHRTPETWWTDNANYSDWAEEMIGIREIILANAAGSTSSPVLTRENVIGMRAPFIRPGGNAMFEMAHDFGLMYDSSVAAPRGSPPYWPFTYDYRQPFDCSNQPKKDEQNRRGPGDEEDARVYGSGRGSGRQRFGRRRRDVRRSDELVSEKFSNKQKQKKENPASIAKKPLKGGKVRVRRQSPYLGRPMKCPTKAFPGLWEIPINPLWNEFNTCHHADQCVFPSASDDDDTEAIVDFLKENFDRHYNTNRAPFQLNFHVTWFTQKRNIRALNKFLDHLLTVKDVWFVTFQQMLTWMRNPKPISEIDFKCPDNSTTQFVCNRPHTCVVKHYLNKDNSAATEDSFSRADTRYMPVCHSNLCPQQYQWFGNTAGRKHNFKTIMQLVDDIPASGGSAVVGGDGNNNDNPSDQPTRDQASSSGDARTN